MYSLLTPEDPNQALRLRRFFMAFSAYVMWIALVSYCYHQGWFLLPLNITLWIFALILAINISVYAAFRTGFNQWFKDPSLTIPQMIIATFWAMVVAYYTDQVRGIVLLLYLVVFIFGVFRLQLRQFFVLALYALAGYGYVIVLLLAEQPGRINLQEEILYWVVLAAVLSWFAVIGSYINHMREKLVKANMELSRVNERIKQSATLDDLTGVFNRRQMIKILSREKSLADRGDPSFSVCLFDLDDFKRVNDTYGHLNGDVVLKTLVQKIKENIREQDYIARYGGEEFVVILAYPEIQDAVICAERLRTLVSQINYPGLPDDLEVTISIGVTRYRPVESLDALIGRADTALYQAKIEGKDRVIVIEPAPNAVRFADGSPA